MTSIRNALVLSLAVIAGGCASTGGPAGTADTGSRETAAKRGTEVKSIDGSYSGEVIGQAAAGSAFGKLKIGMSTGDVQEIMGRVPDRQHAYESGKRWIPFYYGNDARRMQVLYKGQGCLIFTDGNVWGGAGGDLVQIENDASGACYQP